MRDGGPGGWGGDKKSGLCQANFPYDSGFTAVSQCRRTNKHKSNHSKCEWGGMECEESGGGWIVRRENDDRFLLF